jgi:hypothetical protein
MRVKSRRVAAMVLICAGLAAPVAVAGAASATVASPSTGRPAVTVPGHLTPDYVCC